MSADGINVLKEKIAHKSRWLQLPRDVVIGHGVLADIPSVARDLRLGSTVLVVSGTHTIDFAGEQVIESLSRDHEVRRFIAPVISPAVIREVEFAAEGVDFLIGVGGGRVIDTAKIVAYNLDRPFISVPTAASHDGIASARASVPMEGGASSLEAQPPIAIVADTCIIAAAPHRLLAAGCADVLANYTAVLDWDLSHRLTGEPVSDYAVALSRMTGELVMNNAPGIKPHNEESARFVINALVSSGVAMSIAGSSRPGSGGEHKFGHALERICPGKALHGEACGIGTILCMYLHGGDWRGIRTALRTIGAPVTPQDLGIPDADVVGALMMAKTIRPERLTILDMGLTQESAEHIVAMLYQE